MGKILCKSCFGVFTNRFVTYFSSWVVRKGSRNLIKMCKLVYDLKLKPKNITSK